MLKFVLRNVPFSLCRKCKPTLLKNNYCIKFNIFRRGLFKLLNEKKEFHFYDHDVFGFDLDGTLLRYNNIRMISMVYDELIKYLVTTKGYPKECLNPNINWDFVQKGLMLDIVRGNVVKLYGNAKIMKATHGTRTLTNSEIYGAYGEAGIWDLGEQFMNDPLNAWFSPLQNQIRAVFDYFDICAPLLFAQIVDFADSKLNDSQKCNSGDYTKNWMDVLDGLYFIYSKETDIENPSPFYANLKNNPEYFLLTANYDVIKQLECLKEKGKLLFLVTSANIGYASFNASYGVGEKWYEIFDYIIVSAGKPSFFVKERPFLKAGANNNKPYETIPLDKDLELHTRYLKGNMKQLVRSIATKLNKCPDRIDILYIGDNVIQDVYAPGTQLGIRSIAICEELIEYDKENSTNYIVTSEFWGPCFEHNGKKTFFTQLLERNAYAIFSDIDVVANLPPNGIFKVDQPGSVDRYEEEKAV